MPDPNPINGTDTGIVAPVVIEMEISGIQSGSGDYNSLLNKPSIEGHPLVGDSTLQQIGVGVLSVQEIEKILYEID